MKNLLRTLNAIKVFLSLDFCTKNTVDLYTIYDFREDIKRA